MDTAVRNTAVRTLSESSLWESEKGESGSFLEALSPEIFFFFLSFLLSKKAHLSDPAVVVIIARSFATPHRFGRLAQAFWHFLYFGAFCVSSVEPLSWGEQEGSCCYLPPRGEAADRSLTAGKTSVCLCRFIKESYTKQERGLYTSHPGYSVLG